MMNKFVLNLTAICQDIILPSVEKDQGEMREAINSLLFSKDDAIKLVGETSSINRAPIVLFHSLMEIETAIQNLLDTEIYIRRFPYKATRITRIRHLRFVFVNYLNEVYLLKQRLKAFLQLIEELYANGNRKKEVRKVTQLLFRYISEVFEQIVSVRSSHVHKEEYTDRQLERLEVLELISRNYSPTENQFNWAAYFRWQYREIRKQKEKQVCEINKSIEDILNTYFSKLYPIVFSEEDDVIRV